MADDRLFRMVYPGETGGLKITADSATLRAAGNQVDPLADQLTLAEPPKEDLAHLSQESSPYRFEHAERAVRFLSVRPERGDTQLWQHATDIDAGLGELVVLTDLLLDWTDGALAHKLAELSEMTGAVDRAVDRLDRDRANVSETAPFHVADSEREHLDAAVAASRKRIAGHGQSAVAAIQRGEAEDGRALAARDLREADPRQLLQAQHTLKGSK